MNTYDPEVHEDFVRDVFYKFVETRIGRVRCRVSAEMIEKLYGGSAVPTRIQAHQAFDDLRPYFDRLIAKGQFTGEIPPTVEILTTTPLPEA